VTSTLFVLGWISAFGQAGPAAAPLLPGPMPTPPAVVSATPPEELLRGVTFDTWLTAQVPHGDAEVAHVAALGGNCVKLPVPFPMLEVSTGLEDDALARLDYLVGCCRARGLRVILSCAEPGGQAAFSGERSVRQRFVDVWVALAKHYASEPAVHAIIPLERPEGCLKDPKMYGDLCSYLSTQVLAVNPALRLFLAPLTGGSPADAPFLSLERVGALCRPGAEASAEERAKLIEAARVWSVEKKRLVLIDRIAAKPGTEAAERDALVNASFSAASQPDSPLSFVYDTYRVRGPADGVAVSFEADGRFRSDDAVVGLLKIAFVGGPGAGLKPPPAPPTP
jgi:hypothetical protein